MFPGNHSSSLFAQLRYRKCRRKLLDTLKSQHGEIYWFHPNIGRSRVLVVYNEECVSQILKNQSWLFNKALEPWHDRKQSQDPYERLVGDGLFLSDGNHHRKHSSLLMQRIGNNKVLESIDNQLLVLFKDVDVHEQLSLLEISNQILKIILLSAYGIKLTSGEQLQLRHCVDLANTVASRRELCPYRLIKRTASRSALKRIDDVRSMLKTHISNAIIHSRPNDGNSVVGFSQTSILEEVLTMCIGILTKIPSLLRMARDPLNRMNRIEVQAVRGEYKIKYQSPNINGSGISCWPATDALLAELIRTSAAMDKVIKRVNVCDVDIYSVSVPEATEFWVPTWLDSNHYFYGAGCYSCKGQLLSQLIAARYLQSLCREG